MSDQNDIGTPQVADLPTMTAGEKTVVSNALVTLLKLALANNKWAGLVRWAVTIVCGNAAISSNDTLVQVANAAITVGMAGWSWYEKHKATKAATVVATTSSALPTVAEIKAAPTGETK